MARPRNIVSLTNLQHGDQSVLFENPDWVLHIVHHPTQALQHLKCDVCNQMCPCHVCFLTTWIFSHSPCSCGFTTCMIFFLSAHSGLGMAMVVSWPYNRSQTTFNGCITLIVSFCSDGLQFFSSSWLSSCAWSSTSSASVWFLGDCAYSYGGTLVICEYSYGGTLVMVAWPLVDILAQGGHFNQLV